MAVLSSADRAMVYDKVVDENCIRRDGLPLLKAELRAAVDAVDAWIDANSAAYNTAIPQPARGALSSKQKAEILVYVVSRRWQVS